MFTIYPIYRVHIGCHTDGGDLDEQIKLLVRTEEFASVEVDNRSIGCWGWHWIIECEHREVLEALVEKIVEISKVWGVDITPEIG